MPLVTLYFVSCQTTDTKKKLEDYSPEIQQKAKQMTDSIIKQAQKEALFDTTGLSASPIKIIAARLVKKEYSNYKDISLTFKNIGNKKIEAVRFRWYGTNAFGEPADLGNGLALGFGAGFMDQSIIPGKSRTSEWDISSKDGKKIVLAWPYEIAFTDGSKWACGK